MFISYLQFPSFYFSQFFLPRFTLGYFLRLQKSAEDHPGLEGGRRSGRAGTATNVQETENGLTIVVVQLLFMCCLLIYLYHVLCVSSVRFIESGYKT